MAKIEFENKQALNENANIPDINKVKDSDLNEIKNVVNQTILNSLFGVYYDSWQSSETYSIGDIVIYDAILYENLTGNNTATTPDQDSTNWQVVNILLNTKVNPKLIDKTDFIKNTSNNSTTNTYSCDYINKIGTIISNETTTTTATQGQSNSLSTLNIPKGTWIVYGHWEYPGNELSSWTTIWGINHSGAVSCYDNDGYVNMTVQGIAISDGNTVATLTMWPRTKTVTAVSEMWAIKISN